jgi:uncharacterized membrane protein
LSAFSAGIGFLLLSEPLLAQQALKGTFTAIDFPGSTYTRPLGINAEGDVVGNYRDTSGTSHGFVMNEAGFNTVDYPGALFTVATGINARGTIIGYYCPTAPCGPINTYHGFLLSNGEFTSFLDGTIVGLFLDPTLMKFRGYTLKDDTFSPFDFPGATATEGWDINEKGEIVGDYKDAQGNSHGFLWNREGFFSIDYPGSIATIRGSINPEGNIVGAYTDKNNHVHGYLLTRHP